MKRRSAKPVIHQQPDAVMRRRRACHRIKRDQLEPVDVFFRTAVFLGHLDKLAAVVERKCQQPVMPPPACGCPVDLFQPAVLAKREFLAPGLDHVAELGLRRV